MLNGVMSFEEMAEALSALKSCFSNASDSAVHRAGRDVLYDLRSTVVKMHGNYQTGAGEYPDWAPLSQRAKDERTKGGFIEDQPLLRTTELVQAWAVEDEGPGEISLVNDTPYAHYHEEGNPETNLPQRSTIGLALERDEDKLRAKFEKRLRFYMKGKLGRVV